MGTDSVIMDEYLSEKADVSEHILRGEWNEGHDKAVVLLQKDPENIELIMLALSASGYGGFWQDTINYGKKALLWVQQNNDRDLTEANSLKNSVADVREFMAHAYFGLEDYSAAAEELDKIREENGELPDKIKKLAVQNERALDGIEAALDLAEQLDAAFSNRESEDFWEFKSLEHMACFLEVGAITNKTYKFQSLPIDQLRKAAKYILRMVSCFEEFEESQLDEEKKQHDKIGKQLLSEIAVPLYTGGSGKIEMQENNHYEAAEECIMVLEKLSDLGKGFAQHLLGSIYATGCHVKEDQVKAFSYYKSAYENGENESLANLAFYYREGKVTEKNMEKALEYAKKAAALEHEKGYIILKDIARECVVDYDEKLQFVLDTHKRLETDMYALGTGHVTELGMKYARNYMEIEKYYIAPRDRLTFMNICINLQVDLVSAPNGIVSGDFLIDQFEKMIAEDRDRASKMAKERQVISRITDIAYAETLENMAKGNINGLNWNKFQEYYLPKALELGWDGYFADGTGPWKPDSDGEQSNGASSANQTSGGKPNVDSYNNVPSSETKSGGCYIATAVYDSYDCPEVWTLRRFRDYSLAKTIQGRIFIKIYYAISPTLVKLFGNTVWFQQFWKGKLDKIVQGLRKQGYENTPYCD